MIFVPYRRFECFLRAHMSSNPRNRPEDLDFGRKSGETGAGDMTIAFDGGTCGLNQEDLTAGDLRKKGVKREA